MSFSLVRLEVLWYAEWGLVDLTYEGGWLQANLTPLPYHNFSIKSYPSTTWFISGDKHSIF